METEGGIALSRAMGATRRTSQGHGRVSTRTCLFLEPNCQQLRARYARTVTHDETSDPSDACPAPEGRVGQAAWVERTRAQGERIHIPLGAVCNNNCLFCMEDDRDNRQRINGGMTFDRVRLVLERHHDAEEVCFTSGEPTLHARLPEMVSMVRKMGFPRISLMTNGRRLGYRPYTTALVNAGLNRIYVSIHGHTATLHEGLTRTPASFEQTMSGIREVARFGSRGVDLHTSTVITKRNVAAMLEIYEALVDAGVVQVVFNALQVNGRTVTHFDRLAPRYGDVRAEFERLVERARDGGRHAFLVDVPPCITEGLPDERRGYVERHVHYEPALQDTCPHGATSAPGGVRSISTDDLDRHFRAHGPPCRGCRYREACPGVYVQYVKKFGWDDFRCVEDRAPVAESKPSPPSR
jgi:cyclic pyranopterin phosphate synthase